MIVVVLLNFLASVWGSIFAGTFLVAHWDVDWAGGAPLFYFVVLSRVCFCFD
jgi:hypothetical protein